MSEKDAESAHKVEQDEAELARMGYKQELKYVPLIMFSGQQS
jgi:hypothetical protein